MSTSEESPLESERVTDWEGRPEFSKPEEDKPWEIGPGGIILPETQRRHRAEAAHRAEVEPYSVRDRRVSVSWGVILLFAVLVCGTGWAIGYAGDGLGWW